MVNGAWFFSTLAQSTAAIASFIIAISTIFYQLERRRVNERTDEVCDELTKLRQRYEFIIDTISGNFDDRLGDEIDTPYLTDTNIGPNDLRKKIDADEKLELSSTALVWGLLYRIFTCLLKIEPSKEPNSHNLLSQEEINRIRSCSIHLRELMDVRVARYYVNEGKIESAFVDRLVDELIGESAAEPHQQIADQNVSEIENWVDEHIEDSYFKTGRISRAEIDGGNFDTLMAIFENLSRDSDYIYELSKNTILAEESSFSNDRKYILALVIIGVFIPMVPLLAVPSSLNTPYLSEWHLLFFQISLLIVTAVLSLLLIYRMMDRMSW